MRVINLYGGAGSGKSTTAAGLFFHMKSRGYKVELVQEYVKSLAWEDRTEDQAFITANQNKLLHRLLGKVDYVICDASLLLTLAYLPDDYTVPSFKQYAIDLYHSYDNFLDVFIKRVKPYVPMGRYEKEEEAHEKDAVILNMLKEQGIDFPIIEGDLNAPGRILRLIEVKNELEPVQKA